MSDFKPGDINTNTGSVMLLMGIVCSKWGYYAKKQGKNVVLSGKLGVASFSVFKCLRVKHPAAWKNKTEQKPS